MPRFAANLSLFYPEQDFLARFAAAAADGFQAVECLFPYPYPAEQLAELLALHRLRLVLFNAPPGDWAAGERGLACLPGREEEFRAGIHQALRYALTLACPRVHVMAGLLPAGMERAQLQPRYVDNLRWACEQAARAGLTLCIEPINQRDMPGYFLNRQDHALEIIEAVGAANLRLQLDVYHCQIVEGDVSTKLRRALQRGVLDHVQIAGVPERHEPDRGELRVDYLLTLLDELGYAGWVGCEYRPAAGTSAGLGWLQRWRAAQAPVRP